MHHHPPTIHHTISLESLTLHPPFYYRCMRCGVAGSVGPQCSSCNVPVSRYYCDICHLLDDTPGRDIYHCPFCNVCRRGKGLGVDFFHCMRVRRGVGRWVGGSAGG